MALWDVLKAAIDAVITTNGNNEITGAILNSTLDLMVDDLGAYEFKGVAIPSTSPGTPDGVAWYIANTAGTYSNFSGGVIEVGEIGFFKWNGATWDLELLTTGGVEGVQQKFSDVAAEQIVAIPAGARLDRIDYKGKTGTTVVSVGLSSGTKEIQSNRTVAVDDVNKGGSLGRNFKDATNIYINVSGGEVDITVTTVGNIF